MPRKPRNSPNPPGRPPRVTCRRCGTKGRRGDGLSQNGLCLGCAESAVIQAQIDYARRKGKHYDRWRSGMLEWAERLAAEDRVSQTGDQSPMTF